MRLVRKKNAVKIFLALTIFAAFIFLVSSQFIERSKLVLIAKVNGQEIFKSELEGKLRNILGRDSSSSKTISVDSLSKESLELLIKEVYLDKELVKSAKKSKAVKTAEAEEEIAEAQSRVLRRIYLDSVVNDEISNQKIDEKYLEISKDLEGKKEYFISHIMVASKDEADKIFRDLKEKKNSLTFSEIAKKHSIDANSASNGGKLGYVLENGLIKEVAEILPDLQKDDVSHPVQTKFGWHLIKVSDIRDINIAPLEEIRGDIRGYLVNSKISDIDSKILKDAKVQILLTQKNVSQIDSATSAIQEWVKNRANWFYFIGRGHERERLAGPQFSKLHTKNILEDEARSGNILRQIILEKSNAKVDREQQSDKKIAE